MTGPRRTEPARTEPARTGPAQTESARTEPLLSVRDLRAGYDRIEVLHGVDLAVRRGEKVALLGPNGAGKTSLLRALSGMIPCTGLVRFAGADLRGRDPAGVARLGLGHVPEGRGTFPDLTVAENLRIGLLAGRRAAGRRGTGAAPAASDLPDAAGSASDLSGAAGAASDLELVEATFPVLADRRAQPAGSLSGGEQQMLALARALLARPRLLLVDEPSLGLAPLAVRDLFTALAAMQRRWGLTLLLAEQNVRQTLHLCDRAYLLVGGRVSAAGPGSSLSAEIEAAYLRSPGAAGRPVPETAAAPGDPGAGGARRGG